MWLKFVLPVVADVADVEGKFSADLLDTAAMPWTDPLGGEVEGQIPVQAVQVGPGPMAREMISLAQLIKSIVDKRPLPQDGVQQRVWFQLPQQAIPFHLKQRRVYHENLTVSVKDVALVTRGSVGLDHTLDMMAYIPIRDEWVSANRYLASLKGQQIQVPISGTLSAPRIDRRALQQIARQTITNSASKALEQEVTRGLDRLLRPRTTPTPGTSAPPGTPQCVARAHLVFELTCPLEVGAGRQLNTGIDYAAGFLHKSHDVAPANVTTAHTPARARSRS